jgi:hypothetical protein
LEKRQDGRYRELDKKGGNMQEFALEVKQTLWHLAIGGLLIATGAWLAGYPWLIPGLLVGVTASALYFLQLGYRTRKSADMPAPKAVTYMRAGWLLRMGFILLVLLVSIAIPQINFWAAVAGLFSLQVILIMNAVVTVLKCRNRANLRN